MNKDARTEKLYLTDPYTASFEATLLSCENDESGRTFACLDKTYFYPESGGQPSDRGTLGGVGVVEVQEGEAGVVRHYLASPVALGRVECRVDWKRRFDHMQQHTGQHILSRAFIECGKLVTVSFHLGEEACTIDLSGPAPDDEIVGKAERLANSIVWQDRPVAILTGEDAETAVATLRKPLPTDVAEVRLVQVEGFDTVGCCGTHVRRAGEIGIIKILKYEKTKGFYRAHFIAGRRAFDDFARKHDIVKNLANRFTTSVEAIEEKIEKLQSENQRLRKDAQRVAKKLAAYEADRLHENASRHADRLYVIEVLGDADEEYVRLLGSCLKAKKSTVSLLVSSGGLVVCNASDDLDVDISTAVVGRAKSLGGSGGGKGRFATAHLPASVQPADFLRQVFEDVKNA
jgi:alanyl-tRNA synthetase